MHNKKTDVIQHHCGRSITSAYSSTGPPRSGVPFI